MSTSSDVDGARRRLALVAAVVVVAILATLLVLEVHREVSDPGNSDFIAFATGARLVTSDPQHLYSAQAQASLQAVLLHIPPSGGFLAFYANLPAGALVLSPLAPLDLHTGAAVAAIVSLLLFGGSLVLAMRLLEGIMSRPLRALIAVSSVFSVPAIDAVVQWDSLLTCAALVSVLLALRKRHLMAGIVLATLVLKPQTVWLVLPALAAAQSWRYLGGFVLGAAAWVGASIAIAGAGSLVAMMQLTARQEVADASRSIGIPSLVAATTGSGAAGFVAAAILGVGATVLIIATGRRWLRGRPIVAVALGIPLSLLCAPHVSAQDVMVAAPTLLLVARRRPVVAATEALAFSAVGLIQQAVWLPARHLQPLVLLIVAATAAAVLLRTGGSTVESAPRVSVTPYRARPAPARAAAGGPAPRAP
jgi:hypothetical protein